MITDPSITVNNGDGVSYLVFDPLAYDTVVDAPLNYTCSVIYDYVGTIRSNTVTVTVRGNIGRVVYVNVWIFYQLICEFISL